MARKIKYYLVAAEALPGLRQPFIPPAKDCA